MTYRNREGQSILILMPGPGASPAGNKSTGDGVTQLLNLLNAPIFGTAKRAGHHRTVISPSAFMLVPSTYLTWCVEGGTGVREGATGSRSNFLQCGRHKECDIS
jgi:hypothetical protein